MENKKVKHIENDILTSNIALMKEFSSMIEDQLIPLVNQIDVMKVNMPLVKENINSMMEIADKLDDRLFKQELIISLTTQKQIINNIVSSRLRDN